MALENWQIVKLFWLEKSILKNIGLIFLLQNA